MSVPKDAAPRSSVTGGASPLRTPPIDADADVVAGREPPSKKKRSLDQALIVESGLAYIDSHDLTSLSMRRLGARLGVEAMALYRYVSSKEDLLDSIVDLMINQMRDDPDVHDAPTHGWQDFLQRLAHGVRRVAIAHPIAFPLMVSRPPEAPWLRPPLRNIEWVERFLNGLIDEGFSDQGAVQAYRAFSSFLLGNLLLEVSTHGADIGPLDTTADDVTDHDDLATSSTVLRLSKQLSADHSAEEFEESLEILLDRLDRIHAENPRKKS